MRSTSVSVCKKMFLSALGLKKRLVLSWVSNSTHGISENTRDKPERQPRKSVKTEVKEFMKQFLLHLNKLLSHYCRKDTSKLYLEQTFSTLADLYSVYKSKCKKSNIECLSKNSLIGMMKNMNISLYTPKKDKCDICCEYELKNIEESKWVIHNQNNKRPEQKRKRQKKKPFRATVTMDMQAVKICSSISASSTYHKTKFSIHNFTIYNLANKQCTCYWFNETEADFAVVNICFMPRGFHQTTFE